MLFFVSVSHRYEELDISPVTFQDMIFITINKCIYKQAIILICSLIQQKQLITVINGVHLFSIVIYANKSIGAEVSIVPITIVGLSARSIT